MVLVRRYVESDSVRVGVLIADTYGGFNLAAIAPDRRRKMLGPFAFADSSTPTHRTMIANVIDAPSVWVAEHGGEIVGVLRGGRTDHRGRTVLSSLFVDGRHHRQGIGRALVERFEGEYARQGTQVLRLASTLRAVSFYLAMGYKRSTGVRSMSSFSQPGLAYQPMKKTLPPRPH
jgi:GNAT superfamily N-acetyltransferase